MRIGRCMQFIIQQPAWALEEGTLNRLAEIVTRHNDGEKLSADEIENRIKAAAPNGVKQSKGYYVDGNVAVVPIFGVISKYAAGVNDISSPEGTSVQQIRGDLQAALADPAVTSILMDVESPGGSVDGTAELADEIAAANRTKPVHAFANGLMCSAAYLLACNASKITASKSAVVGSIGVYQVAIDTSRAHEAQGIRVNVVRAGAMKGAGTRGTPITSEHLEDSQRVVDSFYDLFINAVAAGRHITTGQARELGDGRVHIGEAAKARGLVDSIGTFADALASLKGVRATGSTKGGSARARWDAAVEANVSKCRGDRQAAVSRAAKEDPALHQAMLAEHNGRTAPAASVPYTSRSGSATADFNAAVDAARPSHKSAADAMRSVVIAQPALHQAMLAERGGAGQQPQTPTRTATATRTAPATGEGSARDRFEVLFNANVDKCHGDRTKALSLTVKENKDLHAEMMAAANSR